MNQKKLRADFATDRVEFIEKLAHDEAHKAGTKAVSVKLTPGSNLGARVEATGPAQDVMHLIGAVAAQGEDFLLLVTPC